MRTRRPIAFTCALLVLALALLSPASAARAVTSAPEKIDPALRALMQANPQAFRPVIVEMEQAPPPVAGTPNVDRANQALELLRLHGTPVAGLSLIDSAAGFANAVGIEALSLVPAVAYIHHDATVAPLAACLGASMAIVKRRDPIAL